MDDADGSAGGVCFKLQYAVSVSEPQSLAKSPLRCSKHCVSEPMCGGGVSSQEIS